MDARHCTDRSHAKRAAPKPHPAPNRDARPRCLAPPAILHPRLRQGRRFGPRCVLRWCTARLVLITLRRQRFYGEPIQAMDALNRALGPMPLRSVHAVPFHVHVSLDTLVFPSVPPNKTTLPSSVAMDAA